VKGLVPWNMRRLALVAGLVVVTGWLVAEVVGKLAAEILVRQQRPAEALAWRPDDPAALDHYAQDRLVARDFAAARRAAGVLLRIEPGSVDALRTLALASAREGDPATADALMAAAHERSRRDATVEAWIIRRSLAAGRYGEAVLSVDALLRRGDRNLPFVSSALLSAPPDTALDAALAGRMALGPDWRGGLLRRIAIASPPRAESLLDALWSRGVSLSLEEQRDILTPVVRARGVVAGRVLWRKLSPGEDRAGLISDAALSGQPGVPPFTWTLAPDGAATAIFDAAPERDGAKALRVEFSGLAPTGRLAEQRLVLPPGRYRLTGEAFLPEARSSLFRWSIDCRPGKRLAVVAPAIEPRVWDRFETEFEVPAGCLSQSISVWALSADDRRANVAYFANLSLVLVQTEGGR